MLYTYLHTKCMIYTHTVYILCTQLSYYFLSEDEAAFLKEALDMPLAPPPLEEEPAPVVVFSATFLFSVPVF